MVVNEDAFNPVVEELRVVAFLAWKQNMILTWFVQFYIKGNAVHETRGGANSLHRL